MALLSDIVFDKVKRMKFFKELMLVILVPLVVSTLSYASRYGAQDQVMKTLVSQQETIITRMDQANKDIAQLKNNQETAEKSMNRVQNTLDKHTDQFTNINRELGVMLSIDSRLVRLEEAVMNGNK